jgi:outer membrane protein assembly factor BamB
MLVGSVAQSGASFRQQEKWMESIIWGNHQALVTSRALFAYGTGNEEPAWTFEPETGVVINTTLAISDGRLFFIESGNPASKQDGDGRITLADLLKPGAFLVSLDLQTGKVAWRKPVDLNCMHHIVCLSAASGKILVSGTQYVSKRIRYELKTYRMADGKLIWENQQKPDYDDVLGGGHGEQVQHLAIRDDTIYGPGFACSFSTGEKHEGWVWHKSHKCTTVSLSARSAFSRFNRSKNPYQFDLLTGKPQRLTSITRPGCYINIIPAAGLVLIPDQSAGCTCEYPIQTSLALTPVTAEHPKPDDLLLPAP